MNERTGRVLADKAWMADKPWTRLWGLLGKKSLTPGEAIVLKPCSSIHTFFMRFPLDVIFTGADGNIVKVARGVKPFRVVWGGGGRQCIEMRAGGLDGVELLPGDQLLFRWPDSHQARKRPQRR